MGSQGSGSNSNGGTQIQPRDPKSNPLARQESFYNLTLDEVQSQLGDLGKPISSMNLDELLKTVCTVEANNQVIGSLGYVGDSSLSLNQQSGLTLSRDLSKKTVNEVWKDIQQNGNSLDRTETLGEITLEDFLVKAGVVAESSPGKKTSGLVSSAVDSMGMPQHGQWMNYPIPSIHSQMLPVYMPGHSAQQSIPIGRNMAMDGAYHETQVTASSSPLMGNLSDTQTPRRKRVGSDDIVEKTVERRQKRMIKNRESAARSRARKQAYTNELENKVMRLEEENERLRRLQELEKALLPQAEVQPKYQLRRTSSAPK